MTTKICTKCNEERKVEDFTKDKRRPDGYGSWCRPCSRAHINAYNLTPKGQEVRQVYYEANKVELNTDSRTRWAQNSERYKVAAQKWALENRDSTLAYFHGRRTDYNQFLLEFKSQPCIDCSKSYPPFIMEFDHVRGEKRFALGKMANHKKEAILEEIAKCELVCCACHRIRTRLRRGDSKIPKVVEFRKWLNQIKEAPCMDCGEIRPPEAMDFDHRDPTTKISHITNMWSWSRDKVVSEIAKCELVCCNCHRIRTHSRLNNLSDNALKTKPSSEELLFELAMSEEEDPH